MPLFRWGRHRRHEPSTQQEQVSVPRHEAPQAPRPSPPVEPWRPVASEFAERVLMLTWAAVSQLADVESTEQDPERLRRLYHTDHALTRIRRIAENIQVLTGVQIDDPGRQITTVLDVIRAAASAVEHYQRIRLGRVVDLAIAEIAADDVIRILTELVDNAIRYSPPSAPVTVSAHLTDAGHVLVRIEDSGIGVNPAALPQINALLDAGAYLATEAPQASHLGLPVVARLVQRHSSLRVQLTPHRPVGTTAMLLIGGELVCEVPPAAAPAPVVPMHGVPLKEQPATGSEPAVAVLLPAQRSTGTAAPMPRRVPASVRHAAQQAAPPPAPPPPLPAHHSTWHDDAADFNAGVDSAFPPA
ncbi:sensor histidine kinase [Actinoplanes sp. GCM10030250]|uniref:sensor histidine kinase n=1 Tax=Actinoplanes sp. GCM10030250 TaxID=3273376 RepID=UPI00362240D9